MKSDRNLGMFFANANTNANLFCAPPSSSTDLPAAMKLWQMIERLIHDGLNGINNFGSALPFELVELAGADTLNLIWICFGSTNIFGTACECS